MENDVLKNSIAPWQEKGRWYKIRVENKVYKSDESDSNFPITYSSSFNYIYMPDNFVICGYKIIYDDFTVTSDLVITPTFRMLTTGKIGISTGYGPGALTNMSFTLYVFGYFK